MTMPAAGTVAGTLKLATGVPSVALTAWYLALVVPQSVPAASTPTAYTAEPSALMPAIGVVLQPLPSKALKPAKVRRSALRTSPDTEKPLIGSGAPSDALVVLPVTVVLAVMARSGKRRVGPETLLWPWSETTMMLVVASRLFALSAACNSPRRASCEA